MSRTHETRYIKWHETFNCKCRLDANVCKNKQRWNEDKCMCECKELIEKGVCDKRFIWNPSICERECNKSRDIGEYLDYSICKCRKKVVDKLVEEFTESIDEVEISEIIQVENKYSSCTLYIVLFSMFVTTTIVISIYFAYFYWYLKKKIFHVLSLILTLKQQFKILINGTS